jgi:hypothetical protein
VDASSQPQVPSAQRWRSALTPSGPGCVQLQQ